MAKRIPPKGWGDFKVSHKRSKEFERYLKYSDKPHYLRKHLYNAENPHSDEVCSLFKDSEERVIDIVKETVESGHIKLIRQNGWIFLFEATKQFESVIGSTITNEEAQTCFVVFKYSQSFVLPEYFKINDVHIVTAYPI
ncbi:hypothetical protein ACF0H5_021857 [Mactra antiquata]